MSYQAGILDGKTRLTLKTKALRRLWHDIREKRGLARAAHAKHGRMKRKGIATMQSSGRKIHERGKQHAPPQKKIKTSIWNKR